MPTSAVANPLLLIISHTIISPPPRARKRGESACWLARVKGPAPTTISNIPDARRATASYRPEIPRALIHLWEKFARSEINWMASMGIHHTASSCFCFNYSSIALPVMLQIFALGADRKKILRRLWAIWLWKSAMSVQKECAFCWSLSQPDLSSRLTRINSWSLSP